MVRVGEVGVKQVTRFLRREEKNELSEDPGATNVQGEKAARAGRGASRLDR